MMLTGARVRQNEEQVLRRLSESLDITNKHLLTISFGVICLTFGLLIRGIVNLFGLGAK